MTNTKQRHLEILAAATQAIVEAGGIEQLDDLPQSERVPELRRLAKAVEDETGCHYDTAKRNVAKACRRLRGELVKKWGSVRPNSGRPPA